MSVVFDDANLVSHAGLVPVMRLADNLGLADLSEELLTLGGSAGSHPGAKTASIVAGMAAGADSIADLDVLRHGGLPRLFTGIRAPSTLGTFLRHFTIGHVAQLEKLSAVMLERLCATTPLLPGATEMAFLDIDSKISEVYGRQKDGAAYGYTRTWGLNFLAACLSTPDAAPVITGTRLRGGNATSSKKAVSFVKSALTVARTRCGATGKLLVRLDSGFYTAGVINAITDQHARFSVTVQQREPVRKAIAAIGDSAWTPVLHPNRDPQTGAPIAGVEIAETSYTAFTNPTENPGQKITARLIVRRHPITVTNEQGELFPAWRYHAFLTNSPVDLRTADTQHNGRAGAIEAVFADLNSSALAHFPSGRFAANAAWLSLAALTHNLMRAAGALAGGDHAKARTATIRRKLIAIPTRIARSARKMVLHHPLNWPWATDFINLFTATHDPPTIR